MLLLIQSSLNYHCNALDLSHLETMVKVLHEAIWANNLLFQIFEQHPAALAPAVSSPTFQPGPDDWS